MMERVIKYVEPSNVIFKRQQPQPVRQIFRKDSASVGPRIAQKTIPVSKFSNNGSFKISQTSVRHSKRFRKTDVAKNTQSYVPQKKEILNGTDNEWLVELYYSLQESALKALRLSNDKCLTAISHFKKSSNSSRIRKSGRRNCFGEPKQTYVKIPQHKPKASTHVLPDHVSTLRTHPDAPPVPPPRSNAISPAPPPPPPSRLLKLNLAAPTRTTEQLKLSCRNPDDRRATLSLIQHLHSLNLRESPYACLPPEYRHSPSSGFYSCSNSIGSCSPLPGEPANSKNAPVIMHSVKSTHVEKPRLQTAIAPDNYIVPPPPPYRCYQAPPPPPSTHSAAEPVLINVPCVAPPSYTSTMQSLAANPHTEADPPTKSCCFQSAKKPPLPPPEDGRHTNNETVGTAAAASAAAIPIIDKVQHQSPIPVRKTVTIENEVDRRDCKARNYLPQAFKFFMEQHVENVLKSCKQRQYRRMQLEKEMQKIGLSPEAQSQMRKMLCQKESNYIRLKRAKMDKSMFEKIKPIGEGAFGEVTLVRKLDTKKLYAMKTLRKADVLRKKQVAHVKAERDILAEADNEWVVKLYFSFQDVENLYFVMEYIPGGDLMSLLIKLGIFKEELARFYLAELTCAIESVHAMGFIHRDIKPDNILIDRDGHIKLTDFGLCTGFRWTHDSKYYENDAHNRQDSLDVSDKWSNELNCKCSKLKPLERRRRRHQRCLAHSLVGTPNYIAPEVLLRSGYTQLCDWWSVGVVLYEMLFGSPPFSADSPLKTQHKIIQWQNTLKIPSNVNVSPAAVDLILKLCTSPEQRLGKNANELKEHPFLAAIDFKRGVRKLTPPYIPEIRHSTDTSNFDPIHSDSQDSFSTSSLWSSHDGDAENEQFHGFFEFTFRRFFDDGGGVPFPTKIQPTNEESENHAAIYV